MQTLLSYWTMDLLVTNGMIFLHLVGAVITGLLIGYERTYHGRAAGMRTYALVCMASTALTILNGYPTNWYGGTSTAGVSDPTRTIQGIMTGIGFLGAGVIVKENLNIRGLSTAASIWLTAAVGVLIGVGFYGAATSAALLAVFIMGGMRWVERLLPHQSLSSLTLIYAKDRIPDEQAIRNLAAKHHFDVVEWAYQLTAGGTLFEFNLVLSGTGKVHFDSLVREIVRTPDILEFRISNSKT